MGFRVEQTASRGDSITNQTLLKRDYIKFFPSMSLSQKLGKSHQLGVLMNDSFNSRRQRMSKIMA